MTPTPGAASPFPLEGETPADGQSPIRGVHPTTTTEPEYSAGNDITLLIAFDQPVCCC